MAAAAFLVDFERCLGCEACVVACKAGNELSPGAQLIHLVEQTTGTFPDLTGGFRNQRCYHCSDAACVAVCPTDALFRDGGLTRLDRTACSGCGYCVEACPFGVPEMADGLAGKCDGCADVVASGGEPWCVKTCPCDALAFGDRTEIVAEATRRAEMLTPRHPDAQVYGETEAGGLGVLLVLPDSADRYGLPADPQAPSGTGLWQDVVRPGAVAATVGAAAAAGLAAVIARRNHMRELNEMEADHDLAGAEAEA